jgi:Flp pilus assembly protein TadG
MKKNNSNNRSEGGATTLEFAIAASIYFMMLVSIVAGGHLYFTHNAMVEATRRGARYASLQCNPGDSLCPDSSTVVERVQNVVVYGTPSADAGATPLVAHLQTSDVVVDYGQNVNNLGFNFGVGRGTVTVSITGYEYNFVVPLIAQVIQMPPYSTTLSGESAGYQPN